MWNEKRLFYEIILPFSRVLEDIEYYGMIVDKEKLEELKEDFEKKSKRLEFEIFEHTGNINLNSSKQLAEALFGRLGIPDYIEDFEREKKEWIPFKDEFRTEKGSHSVDVVVLKKIKEIHQHPVAELILQYRSLQTLLSKFVYGLEKYIHNDGRIHSSFFQLTKGGRPESSKPNLLQIPSRDKLGRKIKEIFISDEGYTIIHMDYSAMELRFLAWLAKDPVMLPAFENGKDVHSITTSTVFGIPYEEVMAGKDGVHKTKRFCAKTTNFLIIFGGSYATLQEQLLKYGDLYINRKECSRFIEGFYDTYPGVAPFQKKVEYLVKTHGYMKNLFGRRRYFDSVKNDNLDNSVLSSIVRKASSHLIQGSSSGDYSALKAVELDKVLKSFGGRFFNILYDGFYVLVKDKDVNEFKTIMGDILSKPEDPVKIILPVDIKTGKKWSEV